MSIAYQCYNCLVNFTLSYKPKTCLWCGIKYNDKIIGLNTKTNIQVRKADTLD